MDEPFSPNTDLQLQYAELGLHASDLPMDQIATG